MKTTLLLPNGFKKIGWAIFVPAFLLGCSICFFGENFDRWLFRETVMNNIAIIGTVVGALFIGFSREKIEDEMIQHIRLNALMAAMWINYLLLIVVSLSILQHQLPYGNGLRHGHSAGHLPARLSLQSLQTEPQPAP